MEGVLATNHATAAVSASPTAIHAYTALKKLNKDFSSVEYSSSKGFAVDWSGNMVIDNLPKRVTKDHTSSASGRQKLASGVCATIRPILGAIRRFPGPLAVLI
jgi:hypothetical protein